MRHVTTEGSAISCVSADSSTPLVVFRSASPSSGISVELWATFQYLCYKQASVLADLKERAPTCHQVFLSPV